MNNQLLTLAKQERQKLPSIPQEKNDYHFTQPLGKTARLK